MNINRLQANLAVTVCPTCYARGKWDVEVCCTLYTYDCEVHAICTSCLSTYTLMVMAVQGLIVSSGIAEVDCDARTRVCETRGLSDDRRTRQSFRTGTKGY